MSVKQVWSCDAHGCMLEEVTTTTPINLSAASVEISGNKIWSGDLCDSCRQRLIDTIRNSAHGFGKGYKSN